MLFFKAVFISAFVKFALVFLPFRVVLKWLGRVNSECELSIDQEFANIRSEVKRALAMCERYTFWKTECYTLALTGKLLLKSHRIPSTLYIGFRKGDLGEYEGHAWLRSYDTIIVGISDFEKFYIQSFFS